MEEVIAAASINKGKILLVNNQSNWSLPGGRKEPGESDIECLIREFEEEFENFSPSDLRNPNFYKNFKGVSPRRGVPILIKSYICDLPDCLKPSRSDEDILELARIAYEDLSSYNLSKITKEITDSLRKDKYL